MAAILHFLFVINIFNTKDIKWWKEMEGVAISVPTQECGGDGGVEQLLMLTLGGS